MLFCSGGGSEWEDAATSLQESRGSENVAETAAWTVSEAERGLGGPCGVLALRHGKRMTGWAGDPIDPEGTYG